MDRYGLLLSLLSNGTHLDTFLQRVVDLAGTVVTPAAWCGLTLRRDDQPFTVVSNSATASQVDEIQYGANEGPNGEQGFYIVADGGPRPWRVRTRPACFINYQIMAKLTEGHTISDIVAVLGSINVVAAELDR